MGDLYSGARSLGQALAGGDAAEARGGMLALQQQGMKASVDKKVEDAIMARNKRQQSERAGTMIHDYLVSSGIKEDDPIIGLSQALVGAGQGQDIRRVQDGVLRAGGTTGLADRFAEDGFTPANAISAALAGKPVPTIDIDGKHVVMGKYSAEPVLDLTKEGEADVQATHALASQREASADASHARAAKTRDEQANPGKYHVSRALSGGGAGRPTLGTMPNTDEPITAQEVRDLFDNHDVMKSTFIRKHGTDRYLAVMRGRGEYKRQVKAGTGKGSAPDAPRDPSARKPGTIYNTPRGPLRWTGTGWGA